MKATYRITLGVLLLSILSTAAATAQVGALTGAVLADSASGAGIGGATIRLKPAGSDRIAAGAISRRDGSYRISAVPVGRYDLEISALGYRTLRVAGIDIHEGSNTAPRATLTTQYIRLDGVVVSASRTAERALDAPASVWTADRHRIAETAALTVSDHLRGVAGVDVAQKGVMQTEVVARGFSNVFSGSLLTLADGRTAGVPSLRANIPYLIPVVNDDIERIEVVRGPGSALFGPNASNGVLNIVTRSPFASQGTSLRLAGGSNELFHGELRHAGTIGERIGYKVSGQYMRAQDWPYVDSVEQAARMLALEEGALPDTLKIGKREQIAERFGAEARVDLLLSDDATLTFTGGFSQAAKAIDLTSLGAAQARDWRYSYLSARAEIGRFSAQGFFNASDAGETYLLRSGSSIIDRSQSFGLRMQHMGVITDVAKLTYGIDAFHTRPNTEGTITGRNESDDDVNEIGGYLQSESRLLDDRISVVLAGRLDHHNRIDGLVFSPRAAVAYKPTSDQQVRLTFNQAYATPNTNDLFLDLTATDNVFGMPAPYATSLRVSGMPVDGYRFRRDAGGLYFGSPFARGQHIPVAATASLWPAATQLVLGGVMARADIDETTKQTIAQLLGAIAAPTPDVVSGRLAMLNTGTGSFDPVSGVEDAEGLQPTITRTLEAGYKGVIDGSIELGLDLYWSRITNFIGAAEVFTPNVFLDAAQTTAYLEPQIRTQLVAIGMPEAEATATAAMLAPMLGAGYGQIPLGTVTPEGAPDSTAILLVPRNYGVVNVAGIDLSADVRIDTRFSIGGTLSLTDNALVGTSDSIPMNAPDLKASLTGRFHDVDRGVRAEARFRYAGEFAMASGVYKGTVPAYGLVDVSIGYRLPWFSSAELSVSATNLLDAEHREFVGAPSIGRMITARASYSF